MVNVFLFINLIVNCQIQVIDPEIQRYFEKKYGYLNNDITRDAPISVYESQAFKPKNSIIIYTYLPQPDYTELPLHYDLKKQNTTGSISYYVSYPQEFKNIPLYTPIDIVILKDKYSSVIKKLSDAGFIMSGEEISKDSPYMVIFGWIDDSKFNKLKDINEIERISISTRNIKAPPKKLLITVKVPNNRNIISFIDKFTSKLAEYGFKKENIEIISNDKKYRFSIIKIKGTIPLDKTKVILKSPFVIDIQS